MSGDCQTGARRGCKLSHVMDDETLYRAVASRDRRFEGRFFLAVRTTGVYCRPGCPAPLPKRRNVLFVRSAAAAEEAGFRPCRRCRPDASPGTPAWSGTSATVARALRLIGDGALEAGDVESLAVRVGVGGRHLRRLFAEQLGASPAAVARTRRLHFARRLLDETGLPITQVAFASGFDSVRTFNHAMLRTFRRSPSELRKTDAADAEAPATAPPRGTPLTLRLPFRPPLDWESLLGWLTARAIPGVESVANGAYRRTVEVAGGAGVLTLRRGGERHVELTLEPRLLRYDERRPGAPVCRPPDPDLTPSLLPVVARVQRLLDLEADPREVDGHLSRDPRLAPLVARRPGLRIPGAWSPFELLVRAVLGQQVSVRAATTFASRLVAAFGRPLADEESRLFPGPAELASADLASIGLTRARAATLTALATRVADGSLSLEPAESLAALTERLEAVPGIGPWTAQYVALRAFGEPDAFPAGDLALRKAANLPTTAALEEASQPWRPFRAYAALHLWTSLSEETR